MKELNDIADYMNNIIKEVQEWSKEPIRWWIELKKIEKWCKNFLVKIKDDAFDDFDKWDKNDLPYWFTWSITNKTVIDYKQDEEYNDLFEKLKEREVILKQVVEANKKNSTINNEDGEVMDCPDYRFQSALVVKQWMRKK